MFSKQNFKKNLLFDIMFVFFVIFSIIFYCYHTGQLKATSVISIAFDDSEFYNYGLVKKAISREGGIVNSTSCKLSSCLAGVASNKYDIAIVPADSNISPNFTAQLVKINNNEAFLVSSNNERSQEAAKIIYNWLDISIKDFGEGK